MRNPFPLFIQELDSGVLKTWSLSGKRYICPNCDLDKTLELLFDFYSLRSADGALLKDNYWVDGYNWFPTAISHLYWRCFYRFVQYEDQLRSIIRRERPIFFRNNVNLKKIYKMVRSNASDLKPADNIDQLLLEHNRKMAGEHHPDILLFVATPNNFRTSEIERQLGALGVSYAYLLSPSKDRILNADGFAKPAYFIHRRRQMDSIFNHAYDLSSYDPEYAYFLSRIIAQLEQHISNRVHEHRLHQENMRLMRPGLLLGMDDTNEIHPVLYACRDAGIPSVGYMVGTYGRRQAAFSLERIGPDEYRWFDKLVVWGEFWRELLHSYTDAYRDIDVVIGANKHPNVKSRVPSPDHDPKNILIPYEYFTNTCKVGEYIRKLIDNGYNVFLKTRPDRSPQKQLECYLLGKSYEDRIVLVPRISDEFMGKINIVGGTMSTMIFDLLPYGKETWIFETEFRLLDEFARTGTVKRVALDDIPSLVPPARSDIDHHTHRYDCGESLRETITREILPMIGKTAPSGPARPR